MSATELFFLAFFILIVVVPMLRRRAVQFRRVAAIRGLERLRNSRVITLIHRQEALGLFGLPFYRFIDIEDSERILRAIRLTPDEMPIDIIVHTPGGLVLAAEQIAHALVRHSARVTVMIPHYAMSGGTLLALAADEILVDPDAILGSLDPQLGQGFPASSIIAASEMKDRELLEDATLILLDQAHKAVSQVRELVLSILRMKMEEERAVELAGILTSGRFTHDFALTVEKLAGLGIPVKAELPQEVYDLMELYPQPSFGRPGVEFIPEPYKPRREEPAAPRRGSSSGE